MTRATGIGSWPGTDPREAIVTVRDLLLADSAAGLGVPYLPETPARGPGADLIGRGAGLLVDLPVGLEPSGWRLADRPGRDAQRTAALRRQDLDELAEAYDGYVGDLKVQVAGPWTLAASVELPRGERVVTDQGAARDLADSLGEGVRRHLADVARLVPGARLVAQVDEPSLPSVLEGSLPTASGYGRVRAVDPQVAARGLQTVVAAAGEGAAIVAVHCCHPRAPLRLLRSVGAGAVAVDLTEASPARWESVAATVEAGLDLWAGCLPSDGTGSAASAIRLVQDGFERAGLAAADLDRVTVTPTCGLAGASVAAARSTHRTALEVAEALTEQAGA